MTPADRIAALRAAAAPVSDVPLRELISADADRVRDFALRVGPIHASFARQHLDRAALDALFGLAGECDFQGRLRALFSGEHVNGTEDRPALHTALRGALVDAAAARAAHAQAREGRDAMRRVIEGLRALGVRDVVSVGIGGSDLGPRLAVDALAPVSGGEFRVHFLSNVDGHAAQRVLAGLDPARTAGLLISKSFGTQETLLNGAILRDWLDDDARLFAITSNEQRAAAYGIA
ncbi:MAG: glucose-6-phosphate isomerase, partial [Pseudomonadota bacterium]